MTFPWPSSILGEIPWLFQKFQKISKFHDFSMTVATLLLYIHVILPCCGKIKKCNNYKRAWCRLTADDVESDRVMLCSDDGEVGEVGVIGVFFSLFIFKLPRSMIIMWTFLKRSKTPNKFKAATTWKCKMLVHWKCPGLTCGINIVKPRFLFKTVNLWSYILPSNRYSHTL